MEYDSQDEMISPNKLFTIYENGYKSQYIELKENNHIIEEKHWHLREELIRII